MKITILTLFPDMFTGFMTNSIIKRAIAANLVEIKIVNIRDYTLDKYGRVDSAPVGGPLFSVRWTSCVRCSCCLA